MAVKKTTRITFAVQKLIPALLGMFTAGSVQAGVTFTNLASFNGANGYSPLDELVQDTSGTFYGTTAYGGPFTNIVDPYNNFGYGTVFKMSAAGALSTLYAFSETNGSLPRGLVMGKNGNLYGVTSKGGTFGYGTVFGIATNGALILSISFSNANGRQPRGNLLADDTGNFYGTTYYGGLTNLGTVFRLTPGGVISTLASFVGTNGANPTEGLVRGSDGSLYGTTRNGGIGFIGVVNGGGNGTVFKLTTNGTLTVLHFFLTHTNDGTWPSGNLLMGSDGFLYGAAYSGGALQNRGALFKISTNGNFSPMHLFGSGGYGSSPAAGLLEARDGNFYGSTYWGGTNSNGGTIFKLTPGGNLTTLASLSGMAGPFPGANPNAAMIQGRDGNLYGTTCFRGVNILGTPTNNGWGSIFRLSVPLPARFETVGQANGLFSTTWSAVVGQAYQVQYTTNLSQPNWSNLEGAVTATNGVMSTTDFVEGNEKRFYRVVLLP